MAKDITDQDEIDIEIGTGFSTVIKELEWKIPTEAEYAAGEGYGPEFPEGTVIATRFVRDNDDPIEDRRTNLWLLLGYFDDSLDIKIKTKDKDSINLKIADKFTKKIFTKSMQEQHGFYDTASLEQFMIANNCGACIRADILIDDDILDEYDTYLEVDVVKLKSK